MPILPAEPQLYPPDLWSHEEVDFDPERPWWCLHTRPRQEKAAARHFLARRLTYYLPQVVQETTTPKGRKIRSVLPMFTGYLFLRGTLADRGEAIRTDCLTKVMDVPDQAGLVRDLRQIYRILDSGLEVIPESTSPVGSRVRILCGPFAGLVGTVFRRDGRDRFAATVGFLGRGATFDLRDWEVEPAE